MACIRCGTRPVRRIQGLPFGSYCEPCLAEMGAEAARRAEPALPRGATVLEALVVAGLAPSHRQGRHLIAQGAVRDGGRGGARLTDPQTPARTGVYLVGKRRLVVRVAGDPVAPAGEQ